MQINEDRGKNENQFSKISSLFELAKTKGQKTIILPLKY